jgi:hypothetical protein
LKRGVLRRNDCSRAIHLQGELATLSAVSFNHHNVLFSGGEIHGEDGSCAARATVVARGHLGRHVFGKNTEPRIKRAPTRVQRILPSHTGFKVVQKLWAGAANRVVASVGVAVKDVAAHGFAQIVISPCWGGRRRVTAEGEPSGLCTAPGTVRRHERGVRLGAVASSSPLGAE